MPSGSNGATGTTASCPTRPFGTSVRATWCSTPDEPPPGSDQPTNIEVLGDRSVFFRWSDAHETLLLLEELRALCRCAHCVGEPDYPISGPLVRRRAVALIEDALEVRQQIQPDLEHARIPVATRVVGAARRIRPTMTSRRRVRGRTPARRSRAADLDEDRRIGRAKRVDAREIDQNRQQVVQRVGGAGRRRLPVELPSVGGARRDRSVCPRAPPRSRARPRGRRAAGDCHAPSPARSGGRAVSPNTTSARPIRHQPDEARASDRATLPSSSAQPDDDQSRDQHEPRLEDRRGHEDRPRLRLGQHERREWPQYLRHAFRARALHLPPRRRPRRSRSAPGRGYRGRRGTRSLAKSASPTTATRPRRRSSFSPSGAAVPSSARTTTEASPGTS